MHRDSYTGNMKSRTHIRHNTTNPLVAQVLTADEAAQSEATQQELEFTNLSRAATVRGNIPLQPRPMTMLKQTDAEQRMWENYDMEDVEFEIVEDPTVAAADAARCQFLRDVDGFGLWDAEAAGNSFGLEDEPGGERDLEEDKLLAEAMRNACEFGDRNF